MNFTSFYLDTLQSKDSYTPATKGQRDLLFQKIHDAGYEWDADKKELKKIEQKPAWSEEDEKNSSYIVAALDAYNSFRRDRGNLSAQEELNSAVEWIHTRLKSIKPQPKQEWSEEDENNILFLTSIIEECFKDKEKITLCGDTVCANFTKEDVINRLKSLKDRHTWKPSDEQMKALEEATNKQWDVDGDALWHLYQDLKKLRKE
jgi:hypothetical protein